MKKTIFLLSTLTISIFASNLDECNYFLDRSVELEKQAELKEFSTSSFKMDAALYNKTMIKSNNFFLKYIDCKNKIIYKDILKELKELKK